MKSIRTFVKGFLVKQVAYLHRSNLQKPVFEEEVTMKKQLQRMLHWIAMCIIWIGVLSTSTIATQFEDVPIEHWAAESIQQCAHSDPVQHPLQLSLHGYFLLKNRLL